METAVYLIPVTLGDTSIEQVLPSFNKEVILGIKYFIVENLRSARRFLKKVELVEKEDGIYLDTNVYDMIGEFEDRLIHSDILGCAFEPGQRFENADGTAIVFDADYFDEHRGIKIIPGPLADKKDLSKPLYRFN